MTNDEAAPEGHAPRRGYGAQRLTAKQRTVLEAARSCVRDDPKATIGVVAARAGCSVSTVNALARRLGYRGWPDMRQRLSSEVVPLSSDEHQTDATDMGAAELELEKVRELLVQNSSKAIFTIGIGDGSMPAIYLQRMLSVHGFDCPAYERQALLAQARLGRSGMLFVFNESGIVLADGTRAARDLGYSVVALTGVEHSPVARLGDILVLLRSNKSRPQSYEPDFYCARALVFVELLHARLPYLYDTTIEDEVALMDLNRQEART